MLIDDHVDGNKAGAESQPSKSQARCANTVDIVGAIGRLPINPTAKLVAITMRTARVTDTKTLAEMLGLSMRVVQRSKNEFADAGDIGGTSDTCVATSTNPATPTSLSEPPRVHARAQMESPSEINTYEGKQASSECGVEEIPGLNGSTPLYVGWLAGFLKGDHGIEDRETARAILAGSVDAYGPDKVRAGLIELKTELAAGAKIRDIGKAFSSFVKNAKPPRADEPPKLSKVEERKAHGLKLLENIRARAAAAEAVA